MDVKCPTCGAPPFEPCTYQNTCHNEKLNRVGRPIFDPRSGRRRYHYVRNYLQTRFECEYVYGTVARGRLEEWLFKYSSILTECK